MSAFDPELVRNFALALFVGALMGVEREKRIAEKGFGVGGLRTFVLLAQAGAVSAWLSTRLDNVWIFAVTLVAVSAMVLAGYVLQARVRPESVGLTTEIAAVTAFLLGAVTLFGYPEIAVALTIVDSAVLAYKTPLHALVGKLERDDIYAGLKLLLATFVVLPLLPNREIDPWGAINPYKAWWLVILIAGLSLVGYVAMRVLGAERGTALTGIFGGLVSSTAVSLSFARESRGTQATARLARALAGGVLLAWTVMYVRVGVLAAVMSPALLAKLALPLAVLTLVALASAVLILVRGGAPEAGAPPHAVPLKNPFSLVSAAKFAAVFLTIMVLVKLAETRLPAAAVYIVAAFAGLTDVDAITLSMANLAQGGGAVHVAAIAVLIAMIANTVVKGGMVVALGAPAMRVRVGLAAVLLVILAAAAIWLA